MTFRRDRSVIALLIAALSLGLGCAKAPNDSQLTQQIQAKLSEDSGLQQKSIAVQTSAGVVTLSGRVDNDAQRVAASRYASATPGIKQVVNNLEVGAVPVTPPATQTAEALAPIKQQPTTKPVAGIPRRKENANSSGRDPSEWDSPATDSSNPSSVGAPTGDQMASANSVAPQPSAEPAAPPPAPAPRMLTIESGTSVAIRLVDAINSETAQPGETFRATLDAPISANGEVAIPAGCTVEGHVVDVKSAGKFAGQSLLVLQLDRLSVGDKSYILQTDRFRRQGSNRSTNTAEKVGGGAAIGAILGGILGGGKGAGIGAAAGGGVGGGVQAAGKGEQIRLASETVLMFNLQSPLTVTQVDTGPESARPKLDTPQSP
jgi:BON domain